MILWVSVFSPLSSILGPMSPVFVRILFFIISFWFWLSRFVWCFHQKASMWKKMLSLPFHLSASTIYRTMYSVFMFDVPSYSVYISCDAVAHVATIPKRINSLCKMDGITIRKLHFLMVARHWKAEECVLPVQNWMNEICKNYLLISFRSI